MLASHSSWPGAPQLGAGFPKARLEDYLKIRLEYSKLINIDSVGPETIRPVTKVTGVSEEAGHNGGAADDDRRQVLQDGSQRGRLARCACAA